MQTTKSRVYFQVECAQRHLCINLPRNRSEDFPDGSPLDERLKRLERRFSVQGAEGEASQDSGGVEFALRQRRRVLAFFDPEESAVPIVLYQKRITTDRR
jgi:hypothetical protein